MPGVSLRHKYSAVPWRMSRQNAGFSGGEQFCETCIKTSENLWQNDRANLLKNPGDLYTGQKIKNGPGKARRLSRTRRSEFFFYGRCAARRSPGYSRSPVRVMTDARTASGAVSHRRIRGPRPTVLAPAFAAISASSAAKPPSAPVTMAIYRFLPSAGAVSASSWRRGAPPHS